MECQRCLTDKEAQYRAYTDMMEIDICGNCAEEARRLGISLALLITGDGAPARKAGQRGRTEIAKSGSTKISNP